MKSCRLYTGFLCRQTFPIQLTVTDEENNKTVTNMRITVSSSSESPFSLATDVPKEISFINDESNRVDLTEKIIDSMNDQPMDAELISSNLTFNFEFENLNLQNFKIKDINVIV